MGNGNSDHFFTPKSGHNPRVVILPLQWQMENDKHLIWRQVERMVPEPHLASEGGSYYKFIALQRHFPATTTGGFLKSQVTGCSWGVVGVCRLPAKVRLPEWCIHLSECQGLRPQTSGWVRICLSNLKLCLEHPDFLRVFENSSRARVRKWGSHLCRGPRSITELQYTLPVGKQGVVHRQRGAAGRSCRDSSSKSVILFYRSLPHCLPPLRWACGEYNLYKTRSGDTTCFLTWMWTWKKIG